MAPRISLSRADVSRDLPAYDIAPRRASLHTPNWFETLLFLTLMSGPPKFRERDLNASLAGSIDPVVIVHVGVWACGGSVGAGAPVTRQCCGAALIPSINVSQAIGALFIAALTLSLRESPGLMLTAFTVGQFAIMLSFLWVFTIGSAPRHACDICSSACSFSRWAPSQPSSSPQDLVTFEIGGRPPRLAAISPARRMWQ